MVLLDILENTFINECVSVPRNIYKEIEKLNAGHVTIMSGMFNGVLNENLDVNYLDAEMIDTILVREVTFKVFTNKEISNNYKKSYQKS